MVQIFKCRILENNKVRPGYFKMIFTAPQIARKSRAGQFVHLRCASSIEPLLRRPFSIYRTDRDKVEILYKVVGRGTAEIAKRKPGEIIDVMGPLGQGFEISNGLKSAILVAGGIGVAPLVMLAREIKDTIHHPSFLIHRMRATSNQQPATIYVLIGAKTKNDILCEEEFRETGCEVRVSTEDGSKGFNGMVTDLLNSLVAHCTLHVAPAVYACGPKEMLKKIAEITSKYNIPAQVSLEENMACGIGACYGCPVRTKQGYKLVCKDGPVFETSEIVWEK